MTAADGAPALSLATGAAAPKDGPATPRKMPAPWKRWVVLLISCIGVLLASISTTALIIAFPRVLVSLEASISTMMYILLVVLLAICAVVPIAGRLGDVVGPAVLYKLGLLTFVTASLGAGFARPEWHGQDLLAARVFIGVGAAFLFVNSAAILTDAFAPYNQVSLAQGFFGLAAAFGTVIGPLVGGGLADASGDSWRWIFWYNAVIGFPLCVLALWAVENHQAPSTRHWREHVRRFDYVGAAFCVLGLILLVLAGLQAVAPDPVLSRQGPLAGLLVGGCVSGALFIADQFYASEPLLPPSVFRVRTFTVTTCAGTLMAFARNSITYNMIFFLQAPRGWTRCRRASG